MPFGWSHEEGRATSPDGALLFAYRDSANVRKAFHLCTAKDLYVIPPIEMIRGSFQWRFLDEDRTTGEAIPNFNVLHARVHRRLGKARARTGRPRARDVSAARAHARGEEEGRGTDRPGPRGDGTIQGRPGFGLQT